MGRYLSPAERRKRFKIGIITIPTVIIVIVVLAVGLHYGLQHKENTNNSLANSGDSTTSSAHSTTATPSTSTSLAGVTTTSSTSSTSTTTSSHSSSSSTVSSTTGTVATTSSYSTAIPTNPVKLASTPSFLGNVTSNNTPDVRDGGWMGNIGDDWIITYADTVPCQKYQVGCAGLESSNSASLATNNPDSYSDIEVTNSGHATYFCPVIGDEAADLIAIWLSNVAEVNSTAGIVNYIRLERNNTADEYVLGTGVASIDISGSKPVCTRIATQWWDPTEPQYGDHNIVLGIDGYIYSFGGVSWNGTQLFMARVLQAYATDLSSYEYWNGQEFTSNRLYNPTYQASVMVNGQGTVMYSTFYKMYLYFSPGCVDTCINVQAALQPQGPWSTTTTIWQTSDSPDKYAMYAPAVQQKYSNSAGSTLVLTYTGFGTDYSNIIQAINMTFA